MLLGFFVFYLNVISFLFKKLIFYQFLSITFKKLEYKYWILDNTSDVKIHESKIYVKFC